MNIGYLIKEGFRNSWTNRMMTVASVGVLVSCLLLTGAASLICINVQKVVDDIGDTNVVNVYLDFETTDEQAAEIGNQIKAIDNIQSCEFYSKDEAIKQFEDSLKDTYDTLQGDENPLPHAYHITMKDLSKYEETIDSVQAVNGVMNISNRSDTAKKLTDISNLVATMGFAIVFALVIISLFIISNTIRMSMYSRRYEISIMKSVGATDSFVRTPFVIEGMVMGAISGIVASLLLMILYDSIIGAVQGIINFAAAGYGEFAFAVTAGFIVIGIVVGALGGFISVGKYLKKEGNQILGW